MQRKGKENRVEDIINYDLDHFTLKLVSRSLQF